MKLPSSDRRLLYRMFFWLYIGLGLVSIAFGIMIFWMTRGGARVFGLAFSGILVFFGLVRIWNAARHLRLFRNKPPGSADDIPSERHREKADARKS